MPFTPKDWKNSPAQDTALSAEAIEDLETRVTDYTDSELTTHTADTTSVHGIADTSVLATDSEVSSAVSTHSADTTSVHGIADTSALATATDVSTAVSDHSADTTSVHGIADTSVLAITVAAPTGTAATDTTAIQNAINALSGGGTVQLREGTYVVNKLTLKSRVLIRGAGEHATFVKLADSANTTVIEGENFATLTGTNSNAGIYGAGLCDLTVNGNKANNATGSYGVAIYGYDNHFENLRITGCKGTGLYHEWGLTSAVNSDTLATGSMECHSYNLKVDRNEGGGIDWYGPSDSIFVGGNVAKNGPASATTTSGVIVRGNAFTCQFTNYHVWGTLHKYGWRLDQACILTGCSAEGATGGNVWLRSGGHQLDLKLYTGGATVPYGLIIGDAAGALFSGDNVIKAKFKDCGIEFQKDSGGSTFEVSYYWSDDTKTFITNTNPQQTVRPHIWRIQPQPLDSAHAAVGELNSVAREVASINNVRALSGQRWAPGIVQNVPRWACDKDLTAFLTSGKTSVIGGLTIPAGQTISSVSFFVGGTALAGTITHLWAAMWDADSLDLLAQSTDEGAGGTMGANAKKTFTFASPYTSYYDTPVYVGVMAAASSGFASPSFWGSYLGNASISQEAPFISGLPAASGLTDTAPDPLVMSGATYSTKILYCSLA